VDDYDSAATARKTVAEYVRYYRFERKHSSIGNLSPHQLETATKTTNSAIGLSVKSSASQFTVSPLAQQLGQTELTTEVRAECYRVLSHRILCRQPRVADVSIRLSSRQCGCLLLGTIHN
jgi:hypothetical protein